MAVTLDATVNAVGANAYATVAEAQAYFDTRVDVPGWINAPSQAVLLMMATRLLDSSFVGRRSFVPPTNSRAGYYLVSPAWTGTRAAANVSRLAWGRAGMYDRNGVAIEEDVFPIELKEATAELAGALGTKDTTLDNETAVQGITGIKAGPVGLTFDHSMTSLSKPLPESVLNLLVPSWFTSQYTDGMHALVFEVVSE